MMYRLQVRVWDRDRFRFCVDSGFKDHQLYQFTGIDFLCPKVLRLSLDEFMDRLEEVSVSATKEHALEISLREMIKQWEDVSFETTSYRDTSVRTIDKSVVHYLCYVTHSMCQHKIAIYFSIYQL